jgi:hypothetical protein
MRRAFFELHLWIDREVFAPIFHELSSVVAREPHYKDISLTKTLFHQGGIAKARKTRKTA